MSENPYFQHGSISLAIVPVISTKELNRIRLEKNCVIIDIRSADSYNGWKLFHEKQNGHIKDSVNIPYKWLISEYWEILIKEKEISRDNVLVLYGSDSHQIDKAAHHFYYNGYLKIFCYYAYGSEWLPEKGFPIESLENYKHIIPPVILKNKIERNEHMILCHCHFEDSGSYGRGHIPGSINLDVLLLESSSTWNVIDPLELKRVLESLGIMEDSKVILYGEFSPSKKPEIGIMAAFRTAQILMYAGVGDVSILNGGLNRWREEGYDISCEPVSPEPIDRLKLKIPRNPRYIIDQDQAKRFLKSPGHALVSVRSQAEYDGETSGYSYIRVSGHIPGSLFTDCGSDSYHMENYRNADQTMRDYSEILKMWKDAGFSSETITAFYCGTGWRASEAWFYAYLMGWKNISVYDGGWFEWSQTPGNPIEKRLSPLETAPIIRSILHTLQPKRRSGTD